MNKRLPLPFGERLKLIRKQRGYNISELADRSGVTQSYISKIEAGDKQDPGWQVVVKLADALNVPIDAFRDNSQIPLYAIIDHLPPHLQDFVLSQKNIPMIEIAHDCVELDLSPEAIKLYVKALAQAHALSHNVKR